MRTRSAAGRACRLRAALGVAAAHTAALLAAGLACHLAHAALLASPLPQPPRGAPLAPPGLVRAAALGYGEVAADAAWLQAIAHFGDRRMHAGHYPRLAPLLARAVALDPKFLAAYRFAGTVLTLPGMDVSAAMEILAQGTRCRADDWRIAFLQGFNAYYFVHDYDLAARSLGRAARDPEAPPHVGLLASRVAVAAGEPELGLALIDTLLADISDPAAAAPHQARRRLLQLEIDLRHLQAAADAFAHHHGHPAPTLDALVQAGHIVSIPDDPLGGTYWLDSGGTVRSHHDAARLGGPRRERENEPAR